MDLSGCSETLESYQQFSTIFTFGWADGRDMVDRHNCYNSTVQQLRRQGMRLQQIITRKIVKHVLLYDILSVGGFLQA